MKIKPCPKCLSDDIEVRHCGYSSFNVGSAKCVSCQFELPVNYLPWQDDPAIKLIKEWNKFCDLYEIGTEGKLQILRNQLIQYNKTPLV